MKAVAYLRTSSAANVGADKDSEKRQLEAVRAYARAAKIEIAFEARDAAVSGADPVDSRPGFVAMLERIAVDGIDTIIVENASRFARDLLVQEVGFSMLRKRGITLVAADSPTSFLDDGPTSRMIRQILGSVAEFEKAMVVAKLKGARDRKRLTGVKVEGRKAVAEREGGSIVVAEARRLRRRNPKTGNRRSLREVAAELAAAGYVSSKGTAFAPAVVSRMLVAI